MRVLVCGSRTWSEKHRVCEVLDGMLLSHELDVACLAAAVEEFVVIEGGAPGADRFAGEWADMAAAGHPLFHVTMPVLHERYPADWDKHGKAAGPIRNQQMLDEGKPDMVLAFVDKPLAESRGTADMVRRAERAGLPVYVIEKRN